METADLGGEMAFEGTLRMLGEQVWQAQLDHEAFERPMRVCDLARCRATCCHDGVVVGEEEAEVIGVVVAEHREALEAYGWSGDVGEAVVQEGGKLRTARRPAREGELAEDFPAHFLRTRCVFLDPEHRCVLQRLATDAGKHPWFWKPVSCWMHPVLLKGARRAGRPLITIRGREDDEARFASCTHCGREEMGGDPASEVLRGELAVLGMLGGRNLLAELR